MRAHVRWLRLRAALLMWWIVAAPVYGGTEPRGLAEPRAHDDRSRQLRRRCPEAKRGPHGHKAIRAPPESLA